MDIPPHARASYSVRMRARASEPHRRSERIECRLVNRLRPVSPEVAALLDLQRSAGNASVTRLLARRAVDVPVVVAPADTYKSWTKAELRPIQRELRRLRLYGLSIDGILGRV
jgi:hypothetical protein